MTTFNTFTKRLAVRLSSLTDMAGGVRKNAKSIEVVIDNELEIVTNYNKEHDASINEWALSSIAYTFGNIPATKKSQAEWLQNTINELRTY